MTADELRAIAGRHDSDERDDCKGIECQIGRGKCIVCGKDWGVDEAHQHRGQLLDLLRRVAALEPLYNIYNPNGADFQCCHLCTGKALIRFSGTDQLIHDPDCPAPVLEVLRDRR
jgi:hypothetical protein